MSIDLHLHSENSDGTDSPESIIEKAIENTPSLRGGVAGPSSYPAAKGAGRGRQIR